MKTNMTIELFEELSEMQHDIWSHWMKYLFSKCFDELGQFDKPTGNLVIPKAFVNRWVRQMNTPYDQLSEDEKESDRKIVSDFIGTLLDRGK